MDVAQIHSDAKAEAEVERALTVMRSVHAELDHQTSDGLEVRVLAALQAHARRQGSAARWQDIMRVFSRGWTAAAMTAALICVFTGGILVARETSLRSPTQQDALTAGSPTRLGAEAASGALPMRVAGAGTSATTETKNVATASARRKPATPILAGRMRGRAAALGVQNRR